MAHILRIIPYTGPSGSNPNPPGAPLTEYFGLTEYDYTPATDPEGKLAFLVSWTPGTPEQSHVDYTAEATMSGGTRISSTWRNVNETIVVRLQANTNAILRRMIRQLEEYLQRAITWNKDRTGTPIYLHYQPGTTNSVMVRSEVLSGRCVLSPQFLQAEFAALQAQVTIYLTRRYYWEELNEVSLLCTSGGPTTTTGVIVQNGPSVNWIRIVQDTSGAGNNMRGDLPAPARLQITYTSEGGTPGTPPNRIWCGAMWFGITTAQTSFSASSYYGGAGFTVSGSTIILTGSNGFVTYGPTTDVQIFSPGTYRLLVSFDTYIFPANFKIRAGVWTEANTQLWVGDWIYPGTIALETLDLGILPIPPNRLLGGQTRHRPGFEWQGMDTSQPRVYYVYFFPAWSTAKWIASARPLSVGESLVDTEDLAYELISTSPSQITYAEIIREGGPIWLHPHHDIDSSISSSYTPYEHRLLFHFLSSDYKWYTDKQFTVKIYYRPRYSIAPENVT